MDEITIRVPMLVIRVPMLVKPGDPKGLKYLATGRKSYYSTVLVGMPVKTRWLNSEFKRARDARQYAERVCNRYYSLWRAEATI